MGFDNKFVSDLSFNLAYFRENYLITKMRLLNEEIEKAEDEETKQALLIYKEELWDITHSIGQFLDRLSLDEHVDPAIGSEIRIALTRMHTSK